MRYVYNSETDRMEEVPDLTDPIAPPPITQAPPSPKGPNYPGNELGINLPPPQDYSAPSRQSAPHVTTYLSKLYPSLFGPYIPM